jgi:hypothetical protein
MYEGNRKRHGIPKKEVFFEERIIPYPSFIVSEFVSMDAEKIVVNSMKKWIEDWKKRGERWN